MMYAFKIMHFFIQIFFILTLIDYQHMIIITNTVKFEKLIASVKCSCLSILSVQHHIINNSHILINFPCLCFSIPTDFSTVIKTNSKCHASVAASCRA